MTWLIELSTHALQAAHHSERKQICAGHRNNVLAVALKRQLHEVHIARDERGKPYLPHEPLQFTVSHSHQTFVMAWTHSDVALGVDVEDLSRRLNDHDTAKAVFSPAEMHYWRHAEDQRAAWLHIWTRKEALLKASGLGMRIELVTVDTESRDENDVFEHPRLGRWQLRTWAHQQQIISLAWQYSDGVVPEILLPAPAQWQLVERTPVKREPHV